MRDNNINWYQFAFRGDLGILPARHVGDTDFGPLGGSSLYWSLEHSQNIFQNVLSNQHVTACGTNQSQAVKLSGEITSSDVT